MKVLLLGGHGRLGQKIAQTLQSQSIDFEIIERVSTNSQHSFYEFLNTQIKLDHDLIILDVSLPECTHQVSQYLLNFENAKFFKYMVGTTGHSIECLDSLKTLSDRIPVCLVPNFSKGIFLFFEILKASLAKDKNLSKLANDLGFQVLLTDIHHKHKKDSPSGTAKLLNQAIQLPIESINSIREGEVVGTHTVSFTSDNEKLEIVHNVTDRIVFADGACDLVKRFFAKNPKPGMYTPAHLF